MPMCDYKCEKCGYKFEVKQKMSAPKLTECPKCNGKVKRLISTGVSLKFKGTGFYCTGYEGKNS